MNTDTATNLVTSLESYRADIEARGLELFTTKEMAALAATAGGAYVLDRLRSLAWDFKSDDSRVVEAARNVANAAENVVAAVGAHQQVHGSMGGETWVSSYARDLQKAVDERQAKVRQFQEFRYAAKQLLADLT